MRLWLTALMLLPTVASAQLPVVPSCLVQDTIEIVDDGQDQAVVIYYNSSENCSSPAKFTLTSPNGISVKVEIIIGGEEVDKRELIYLTPLNPHMMSFPPDGKLLDGETMKFIITVGLS